MVEQMCSYCNQVSQHFEVSGMRKLDGNDFISYQLCKPCNSMLANLNPRVEAEKRRKIWDTIWQNLK